MPVTLAEELAATRATPGVQDRIDELAEKSNEGKLTPQERAEYEAYVDAIDVIRLHQVSRQSPLSDFPPS
jgi:hypothetical protein